VNAPKLALVEYNAGNLASVERAFARLGAQTYRAARPADIAAADALVLPGVGHFGALLNALRKANLDGALQEAIAAGSHSSVFALVCRCSLLRATRLPTFPG